MSLIRFFQVVAFESYDSTSKLADIVKYKYMSTKKYFKTRRIKKELKTKMKHANSYAEWHSYAEKYDQLAGKMSYSFYNDVEVRIWKEIHHSDAYDWAYIEHLTQILHESRLIDDFIEVMHIIRSNLMRNIANILNPSLYCKSYTGTKHIIEDFQKEVIIPPFYIHNNVIRWLLV